MFARLRFQVYIYYTLWFLIYNFGVVLHNKNWWNCPSSSELWHFRRFSWTVLWSVDESRSRQVRVGRWEAPTEPCSWMPEWSDNDGRTWHHYVGRSSATDGYTLSISKSFATLWRLVSSTMLNMGTLQKSAGGRFWFGYVWICEHATCQAGSERSESSVKVGPMVGLGTNSQSNSQSNNKFPNIYQVCLYRSWYGDAWRIAKLVEVCHMSKPWFSVVKGHLRSVQLTCWLLMKIKQYPNLPNVANYDQINRYT